MSVTRADLHKGPFRNDGRVIVSYPKSGRTWIAYALSGAGLDVTTTHAGSSTNRREVGRTFAGIQPALRDVPLVFLHRNPIDTAVSMFHQIHRRDFRRGSLRWWRMLMPLALRGAVPPRTIDSFVLHPLYGVEKVCAFNRTWLNEVSSRPDCISISYEQLRADPSTEFQQLIDFFGVKHITGADLADAADFAKMRTSELSLPENAKLRIHKSDPQSMKVRRGKVNGYFDELRADTIEKCEAIIARYAFADVSASGEGRFRSDRSMTTAYSASPPV